MLMKRNNGLNPCCNGIWSQTIKYSPKELDEAVLILVVMEYGLRLVERPLSAGNRPKVLILVVMEYGLRHFSQAIEA